MRPASIHDLYMARGRGETHGFTVPAINVRGMAYDTARSIFRTAIRMNAGAFLLEIARSEIAYTDQRPGRIRGRDACGGAARRVPRPGVHPGRPLPGERQEVRGRSRRRGRRRSSSSRARRSHAGFYNIDIDTSTLVDYRKPTLDEQQRLNYEVGIDILKHVRSLEPKGVTISVGGEIGEVGTANSTVEELRAYMDGFNAHRRPGGWRACRRSASSPARRTAASCSPDGSIADVKLDLDTLERLSQSGARRVRAVRRRAARRVHAARHGVPQLSQRGRRRRSIWPRTSRTCCTTTFRRRCATRSMPGCGDTRRASGSRPTPTSSSSTRRARRRSGPFKRQLLGSRRRARKATLATRLRREVRVPVRAAGHRQHRVDGRQVHHAAHHAPPGAGRRDGRRGGGA